jgi:hypothetical protein
MEEVYRFPLLRLKEPALAPLFYPQILWKRQKLKKTGDLEP